VWKESVDGTQVRMYKSPTGRSVSGSKLNS
jgi:hypothetical protein